MIKFELLSDDPIMNVAAGISVILFSFLFFLFSIKIIGLFRRPKHEVHEAPVSVLIPMYNESSNIVACLNAIKSTNYPKDLLEIVVIDDESTDDSVKLVESFAKQNNELNVRLIHGKHQGKSEALNLGLKFTASDLVLTIDADVQLKPDSIELLVAPLKDKSVAASNAVAVIHEPKKMLHFFQMIEFNLNNIIRSSFSRVFKNSIWFFGAVACYNKEILQSVGGFKKDTLTEDMDLSLELFSKGYKIVTVEKAVIRTVPMRSISELFTQRMRWYYGALQSLYKHKTLLVNKRTPEVIFLFFNQWWWTLFAFVFFPLTAYQVWFWMPAQTTEIALYLIRWFSLWGPFYVLYNIPNWGLSAMNIFGVASGLITLIMSLSALYWFKGDKHPKTLVALFFYFPYTIVLNAVVIAGVCRYAFAKNKYFIK